ncbi:hypothetical protein C6P46_000872 [Rhodotorula mucilaginosa]|jgi:hypothetical protein|uniref:Uncharacterized protein n=1 Tax=Rhodotorula mucilaginosa TaxID=5537 RepID=A0A9P6VVN4_RHOMI|nr:hypothetical protein C6P46_000872 [Rhodotorula mucilaginosa]
MPDYLEARRRPLRISRTAHLSPTPDLDPHPSASPAGGDSSNGRVTGPVAASAHVTVSHSTFSTRSVLSGVSAFLDSVITGPARTLHHRIEKVLQPSAKGPVPLRRGDGVERRVEAKRASRSAGETDKVASTQVGGPEQYVTAIRTPATRTLSPRAQVPARQRSVSVASPAAATAAKPSRSSSSSRYPSRLTNVPALAPEVQDHRIRLCTCSPEYNDEETTSSEEEEETDSDGSFFGSGQLG